MFTGITTRQGSTLKELQGFKRILLNLLGIDAEDDPVVWICDAKRRFPMAIRPEGNGTSPSLPVREISLDERKSIPGDQQDILFCMEEQTPTLYFLTEVWHEDEASTVQRAPAALEKGEQARIH